GVGLGDAPEGAAAVVVVDQRGLPAVLVDVEVAPGVDVPRAALQGRGDVPDAVQLVAGQRRVEVAGFDHLGVLEGRRVEPVAVVGDVDLLLADQLPVVAIQRAVVHVQVVGSAHAVGGGAGAVVGDLRGAAHAALAGVVEPGQARF